MLAALHGHGEYSLLDGAGTSVQHVEAAKAAGYGALALTDHGTLAGVLHHMRACREGGILPIVGCEVYYRPNRKVQGQKEWQYVYYHLTLHAKDERGWRNLMALVSESHRSGFYGKACVDDELLDKYHEGLICLTGCLGGRLCKSIVHDDDRQAEAWLRQLKRVFGDDLFVEIMPHDYDDQRKANIEADRMADHHGLPKVVTLDSHYPTEEWRDTQDVLLMIATNQTVKERAKKREEGEDVYEFLVKTFYHQTEQEIRDNFAKYHPGLPAKSVDEGLTNQLVAASRVLPFLVDANEKMPAVAFPNVPDNRAYLRKLAFEGLARRGYANNEQYVERVEFELKTFDDHGVVDYMLMVWDIVDWAKSDRGIKKDETKLPIMVGPGRGSAAGSVVSWAIGITNINPINHRLLFERFLNPDRKGLPDIDIDFPPDRIDEVEDYVKARYGKDRVVDIIAHSTFGPRAALTDVGRVLAIPYEHVKAATKTIDDQDRSPLEELRAVNQAVDRLATQYPIMWDHACRLQGQVARKSEHAGGVLITPGPYEEYIPVERTGGQKGKLLTAFGERSGKGNALISDFKYTKIDLLRVAELSKQQYAVELIFQRTGERIDLDALPVHDDPYDVDPKVMQGFKDGLFVGIFQWSGVAGKLTRQAKPDNVFELAALNALIRPGPRGNGTDMKFVDRKHGREESVAWHPKLEPYLDYTQNLMVFQEQLIEVVHQLGGLTRAEADNFRKISSKLYRDPAYAREVMGQWYEPIRDSFIANGIDPDVFGYPTGGGHDGNEPTGIWKEFLSFSDYSFNLSHADAYAVLAYRDMWLKVYYPREFYAAFLSKGLSQITKKKQLQKQEAAREARSLPKWLIAKPLKIMPPDINESGVDYTVVDDGIRLGLEAIKNVGPVAAKEIQAKRPFVSYQQFEEIVIKQKCNRTVKASLIMAGAFDRWGMRNDYTEDRIDQLERDLMGMSLTSVYSVDQYAHILDDKIWTEDEVESTPDGTAVAVAGEVTSVKEIIDAKGGKMAFVGLAYGSNQWECTVFSYLYAEFEELVKSRRPILVTGTKNVHNGRMSIKVASLPPDSNGESTPPIMDLQDYAEMLADEGELLAQDSVFPEDMADAMNVFGAASQETAATL